MASSSTAPVGPPLQPGSGKELEVPPSAPAASTEAMVDVPGGFAFPLIDPWYTSSPLFPPRSVDFFFPAEDWDWTVSGLEPAVDQAWVPNLDEISELLIQKGDLQAIPINFDFLCACSKDWSHWVDREILDPDFPKDRHLRTFLPLSKENWCHLTNHVPNCLLPRLRCLRVLSLRGYEIFELPNSIGDLKHLRYFNLSGAMITSLPESISSLYNLQTLILKGCSRLIKLPEKIENLVNLRHLDITNVNSIKEMPVGIGELKSLQTLTNFVVGKDPGSKIGGLMNLKFLQGRLCISRLENVLDPEDARRANLNGKKNLDELAMKWESADDDLQDAKVAMDVLDMLRPWTTVKELSIDGYVGVKFPTWLGHPSFSNMVLLRIESCRKCTSLPAIGQLPSLKNLVIIGMANVQRVGPEFYGEGCLKPFQSLETLCFEDLQEWQDWIPSRVEYEGFPHLRELSISHCPKLQGKLPYHLPSLEKFSIRKCEELVVSIPSLPMLHKLEIVECKEVVRRNTVELCSIKSIVFSIPDLKSLTEEFMHGLVKVENLTIDDCKELTSMWQDKLMYLVALDIQSCPSLITLNLMSTIRTLTIKGLEIRSCEKLQSVVDEGEAPSSSSSLLMNQGNLKTSVLEQLEIWKCSSLKCLSSRDDLPTTLKILGIYTCLELTSLSSSGQLPTALKQLTVEKCPKLESVADKLHDNASLESLEIRFCEKLKSLPEGLHKLCHLNQINIRTCSSLVSFPDGGLLPTSLRQLWISNCEKLEALPNRMHNLTSLHDLSIMGCGSIISFPEEGYPTNLTSLRLRGVNICKQVFEWGLHRLTSLTSLSIGGGFPDWQSFPSEEEDGKMMMTLPTSLTQLWIGYLPNIIFLSSKGFQNLSGLQHLEIYHCPKLEFLPEKGLPPSLLKLNITDCPLLKQHCKKGKGREWLNIVNIPRVLIDHRLYIVSWNMMIRICPCLKEVVNASQALNYCKHMVMICQEVMAGNHSLRRCKAPVCNWTCFVDCQEWQLASANFGGNWYQKRVSGETIHEALSYVLKKGMLAALVLTSSSEVCSLCCGNKHQAGRYKLLRKTLLAVLHPRFFKLWSCQVPRPILYNARQLVSSATYSLMHIA
uniref:R13L1/DRL21-like LRR repeat region domain-containing protein n=1 Tax=Fagus sylvatica TaxID=28930 RepID=A0A2N9GPY3_FAGSY